MKINKSWIQAGLVVAAIFAGIWLINRYRAKKALSGPMSDAEANILAGRLSSLPPASAEAINLSKRLAVAGYKVVAGKAIKI